MFFYCFINKILIVELEKVVRLKEILDSYFENLKELDFKLKDLVEVV